MRHLAIAGAVAIAVLVTPLGLAPAANAAQTYSIYHSRSEVVLKAGVINVAAFMCGGVAPWYLSFGCRGGDAQVVFDFAALKGCKVKQVVTLGAGTYSWNRATHVYYPYECIKPNA